MATIAATTEAEGAWRAEELPTIWRVPDDLWAEVKVILDQYRSTRASWRNRIDQHKPLDAVIFRMRSGCQRNQLPKEFGYDSSVHRTFQRWQRLGIFDPIWPTLRSRN